ncbi:sulfurtransferase [Aerosticca soli]|uniref:Thiosulfate sulfurtransferase, rhodanese n=1 Tax=Aerosticca soli TaxID=2010829 RepID=A0A2Z6E5P8_9GAMM|nr:sulfurtransferase [Aerosticca soli]BBD80456.1 thiosulfate sulfurtransferase, rhodanese [Aerosticca soli]
MNPRYATLIDAVALAALPPARVLIVDCRCDLADADKGRRDYRSGHLPGAVHAELHGDLSDPSRAGQGLGRHPLPREEAFAATLGRWGWQPDLQVVCYDDAGGAMAAARLWWLLLWAGVPAAVLDGGLAAWRAAGLPLETSVPERTPTRATLHFDANRVVLDADELRRAPVILDARAAPRFRGEVEPLDRVAGHVPGARNHPYTENLQPDGRFKPAQALREAFLPLLGGHPPQSVVHMCGSGVTACHNVLAMEHAGLCGSRLYAPSWSGWVSDPSRPVARGADA